MRPKREIVHVPLEEVAPLLVQAEESDTSNLSKDLDLLALLADLGWKQVVDVQDPHLACAIDAAGQTVASYSKVWGQWFLSDDLVTPFESFHAAILGAHKRAEARKFFTGLSDGSTLEAMLSDLGWKEVSFNRCAVNRRGETVGALNHASGQWFIKGDHADPYKPVAGPFTSFEEMVRYAHQDMQTDPEFRHRTGFRTQDSRTYDPSRVPTRDPVPTDMRLVVESLAELNATLRQPVAAPALVSAGVTEDQVRAILEAGETRVMEQVHALLRSESTVVQQVHALLGANQRPIQAGPALPEPSAQGGWWNLEGVDMVGSVRVATLNKKVAAGVLVLTLVEAPGQPVSTSIEFVPGGDTKSGKIVCVK